MDLFSDSSPTPELLREIKKLHFQTKRMADQAVVGSYRSAFRGRGIEFEEVREYTSNDDIRDIDWKVTARAGKPFVKRYREERDLTVLIAVDVSASTRTGSQAMLREKLLAQIGAVLTLIALTNKDNVGLVTFSDRLETYHPPRKARGAVWRILREVLSFGEYRPQTDLAGMFRFMSSVLRRRAIIFVLSDFFATDYEGELAVLAKRHDVTLIQVVDPIDYEIPNVGLIRVRDPESNTVSLVDTSSTAIRTKITQGNKEAAKNLQLLCRKHKIGQLTLKSHESFIEPLRRYFSGRSTQAAAEVSDARQETQ